MAMLALLSPERLDHVDDGSWLVIMPHPFQYCGRASFGEAQLARHIRSKHLDTCSLALGTPLFMNFLLDFRHAKYDDGGLIAGE